MEQLLLFRNFIITVFKRYETIILFVFKLFVAIFVFSRINLIGNSNELLDKYVKPTMITPLTMLFSVLFTITPVQVGYALIILTIGFQMSGAIELAVVVVLALLAIQFLYVQMAPKESIFILATVLAYYFNLPYVVPIFGGIYCGLTCIVPITIGVFIWNYIPLVFSLMPTTKPDGIDILAMPAVFSELLNAIINNTSSNQQWIFSAFILAMAVIVAFGVSRLSIDYSRHLALGLAAVLIIISFMITAIVVELDLNFLSLILSVIVSSLIMVVVEFFDLVLDYQRAERVQFEDDNNYYYVRVIPKIVLPKRKMVVTRINSSYEDGSDSRN